MSRPTAAVVLAAGKGTRFKSDLAKVLHRASGRTLLGHMLHALEPLDLDQVVVVVGHQADDVRAEAEAAGTDRLTTVVQEQQLGTGHATQIAMTALDADIEHVVVMNGDHPLLTAGHLTPLLAAAEGHAAALLTAEPADPSGLGRVLRDDGGDVAGIVEERDADADQRALGEINTGIYAFDRARLAEALGRIDADNAQGELYLTDVVGILRGDGHQVTATVAHPDAAVGVNDRSQLAAAAAALRARHLEHLMVDVGVTVIDPAATYVDVDVEVGRDTVLLPGTILTSGTRVGEGATVGPHSRLVATEVGDGATVDTTVADSAVIGPRTDVGPFTHLRPGTRLEAHAKAGAFVQVKAATIGPGSKVPHLSYVGDATIGAAVNLGCGVVTVNYDGFDKHHTTIEDGAFVSCDTMLIAPVTVGHGAFVAAATTVTDDVPPDALAIGRARQTNKEGWAARRRAQDAD